MRRAVAIALLTLVDARVLAQQTAVDTSVQAGSSVDDNFLFQSQAHPTVLVLSLTPSLTLSRDTESSDLRADASATSYEVPDHQDMNHTNLHLALSYSIKDETNQYALSTAFARDLTVESELETTGVLLEPLRHNDLTIAPSWTHSFSERLQGQLQVSAEASRYSGATDVTGVTNYHYYTAPLSTTWLATESDSLTAVLSASYYRSDRQDDHVDTAQFQAQWQHTFEEGSRLSFAAGGFDARTHLGETFTVCPLAAEFCQLGLIPYVTLQSTENLLQRGYLVDTSYAQQIDEGSSFTVHASRNLAPSGAGTLIVSDVLDVHYKHALTEAMTGELAYVRAQSRFLGVDALAGGGFESAQADISWKTGPSSNVEFGVKHADTFLDGPAARIRANEIYANFRYSWPQSAAAQAAQQ